MALRDEMMKGIYSDKDAKLIRVHPHIISIEFSRNVKTEVEKTLFEFKGSAKLLGVDIAGYFSPIGQGSGGRYVFPKVAFDLYLDGEFFASTTQSEHDSNNQKVVMNKIFAAGDLMLARMANTSAGNEFTHLNGRLNPVRIDESLVLKIRYQIDDDPATSYYGNNVIAISHIPGGGRFGIVIIED